MCPHIAYIAHMWHFSACSEWLVFKASASAQTASADSSSKLSNENEKDEQNAYVVGTVKQLRLQWTSCMHIGL